MRIFLGKVYYLTKAWSLTENLMTVLRFPYQAEQVETYQVTQRRRSHVIQRELMGKNPRWMRRRKKPILRNEFVSCLSDQDFFPQVRFQNLSRVCTN